ncbi:MbtH family protein [Phenylobacterium sp.]|uniref:MbtH family protein n=1 Tax=Phenylobacterium sp. TaxID=1871053 RepID=UPI003565C4AA
MSSKDGADGEPASIDGDHCAVLVNAEGQYSIWPAGKAAPEGWTLTGPSGSKAECIAFIEAQWTDMRPASLGAAMDRDRKR